MSRWALCFHGKSIDRQPDAEVVALPVEPCVVGDQAHGHLAGRPATVSCRLSRSAPRGTAPFPPGLGSGCPGMQKRVVLHTSDPVSFVTPPSSFVNTGFSSAAVGTRTCSSSIALRHVIAFEAIDNRTTHDRNLAAGVRHVRVRRHEAHRHGQFQLHDVTRLPLPLDAVIGAASRRFARSACPLTATRTGPFTHPGMRRKMPNGFADLDLLEHKPHLAVPRIGAGLPAFQRPSCWQCDSNLACRHKGSPTGLRG